MSSKMSAFQELGRRIQKYFQQIIHICSQASIPDNDQVTATIDPSVRELLSSRSLQKQQERFQLWSVTLGLFDSGHSSLAYRLEDAAEARDLISDLLEDLASHLAEIEQILAGERQPHERDSPGDVDIKADESDESDASSEDDESELSMRMSAVVDILDRLFKIARSVRNPATRSAQGRRNVYNTLDAEHRDRLVRSLTDLEILRIQDLIRDLRKEEGDKSGPRPIRDEDITTNPPSHDASLTIETSPETLDTTDITLSKQLGKVNSWRRQQFAHWRRRHDRSTANTLVQPMWHEEAPQPAPPLIAPEAPTQNPPVRAKLVQSMPSSVTKVKPGQIDLQERKSVASNITRAPSAKGPSGERAAWPPPPEGTAPGDFFHCPYCFNLCPDRYLNPQSWRSHLIHDLRPYSCTYNQCESADHLYDSYSDWTSHEILVHNQAWQCLHHPNEEFKTQQLYILHITEQHTEESRLLLSPEMLNARRVESSASNRLCPFCLIEEHDVSTMQKHVAWHLETIAVFALPRSTGLEQGSEGGELNSNQSGRVNQDSRIGDEDQSMPPAAGFEQDDVEDIESTKTGLTVAALSQALASGAVPDTSGLLDPFSIALPTPFIENRGSCVAPLFAAIEEGLLTSQMFTFEDPEIARLRPRIEQLVTVLELARDAIQSEMGKGYDQFGAVFTAGDEDLRNRLAGIAAKLSSYLVILRDGLAILEGGRTTYYHTAIRLNAAIIDVEHQRDESVDLIRKFRLSLEKKRLYRANSTATESEAGSECDLGIPKPQVDTFEDLRSGDRVIFVIGTYQAGQNPLVQMLADRKADLTGMDQSRSRYVVVHRCSNTELRTFHLADLTTPHVDPISEKSLAIRFGRCMTHASKHDVQVSGIIHLQNMRLKSNNDILGDIRVNRTLLEGVPSHSLFAVTTRHGFENSPEDTLIQERFHNIWLEETQRHCSHFALRGVSRARVIIGLILDAPPIRPERWLELHMDLQGSTALQESVREEPGQSRIVNTWANDFELSDDPDTFYEILEALEVPTSDSPGRWTGASVGNYLNQHNSMWEIVETAASAIERDDAGDYGEARRKYASAVEVLQGLNADLEESKPIVAHVLDPYWSHLRLVKLKIDQFSERAKILEAMSPAAEGEGILGIYTEGRSGRPDEDSGEARDMKPEYSLVRLNATDSPERNSGEFEVKLRNTWRDLPPEEQSGHSNRALWTFFAHFSRPETIKSITVKLHETFTPHTLVFQEQDITANGLEITRQGSGVFQILVNVTLKDDWQWWQWKDYDAGPRSGSRGMEIPYDLDTEDTAATVWVSAIVKREKQDQSSLLSQAVTSSSASGDLSSGKYPIADEILPPLSPKLIPTLEDLSEIIRKAIQFILTVVECCDADDSTLDEVVDLSPVYHIRRFRATSSRYNSTNFVWSSIDLVDEFDSIAEDILLRFSNIDPAPSLPPKTNTRRRVKAAWTKPMAEQTFSSLRILHRQLMENMVGRVSKSEDGAESIQTGPPAPIPAVEPQAQDHQPSFQEVFTGIASAPYTLSAFTAFLSEHRCLEILQFYTEATRYAEEFSMTIASLAGRPGSAIADATFIMQPKWDRLLDVYVRTGAPRRVILTWQERHDLLSYHTGVSPPPPEVLGPSIKRMHDLLNGSLFVQFCKSLSKSPKDADEFELPSGYAEQGSPFAPGEPPERPTELTEADAKQEYNGFEVRSDPQEFFQPGRVFDVLWPETNPSVASLTVQTITKAADLRSRHSVLRMVVDHQFSAHSSCFQIITATDERRRPNPADRYVPIILDEEDSRELVDDDNPSNVPGVAVLVGLVVGQSLGRGARICLPGHFRLSWQAKVMHLGTISQADVEVLRTTAARIKGERAGASSAGQEAESTDSEDDNWRFGSLV